MMTKLGAKAKWVALLGILTVGPLASVTTAEAKPPAHAKAWGYRAKQDSQKRSTWKKRTDWRNRTDWRDRDNDRYLRDDRDRRYRLRYRTKRDRNGRTYREYYRQYIR